MTRGLHSDVVTELATDDLTLCDLLNFQIGNTTYYKTTAYHDIVFDGNTYTADGSIIGIPSLTETNTISTSKMTINLNGIDLTFVSLFLSNEHIHKPVNVFRAFLTDNGAIIGNPYEYFTGFIHGYQIEETNETTFIKIEVANHWSNFGMSNGRRTNNNSQQKVFPNDVFFNFTSQAIADINWGKEKK